MKPTFEQYLQGIGLDQLTPDEINAYRNWGYWTKQNAWVRANPSEAAKVGTSVDERYDDPANKPNFSPKPVIERKPFADMNVEELISAYTSFTQEEKKAAIIKIKEIYPDAKGTPWGVAKGRKAQSPTQPPVVNADLNQVMSKLIEIEQKVDAIGKLVIDLR